MKKITNVDTEQEIAVTNTDLPMLIHGVEGSGASLLSITISAMLHKKGNKLVIFTAYPMAREEFMSQIEDDDSGVFFLKDRANIVTASQHQTVIVESGNIDLFKKFLSESDLSDRIIFIKNIETIHDPEVLGILSRILLILSGDINLSVFKENIINTSFKTEILLSPLSNSTSDFSRLPKYQAFLKKGGEEMVISLK
jgi:hypothetical protein